MLTMFPPLTHPQLPALSSSADTFPVTLNLMPPPPSRTTPWQAVLRGMAAIAALMGDRAVLLPELPCDLDWIYNKGLAKQYKQQEQQGQAAGADSNVLSLDVAGGVAGVAGVAGASARRAAWSLPLPLKEDFMAHGPLTGTGPRCIWQRVSGR